MHMLYIPKVCNIYWNMFTYMYIYSNIMHKKPFKSFFSKAKYYGFIFLTLRLITFLQKGITYVLVLFFNHCSCGYWLAA